MKILVILATTLLFNLSSAYALDYYPWHCEYKKDGQNWYWTARGLNLHNTVLDFNQSAIVSKNAYMYKDEQSGVCGYIGSDAYQPTFNIVFVRGQNLNFPPTHSCEYVGSQVQMEVHSQEITKNDSFFHAITTIKNSQTSHELMYIIGISKSTADGRLDQLCADAFRAIEKKQTPASFRKLNLDVKQQYLEIPGAIIE